MLTKAHTVKRFDFFDSSVFDYDYDSFGLMTNVLRDGNPEPHIQTPTSWSINGVTYNLDDLGRVTQRGSKSFTYGPNRRIQKVEDNSTLLSNHYYDEENNPVTKTYANGDQEVYFADMVFANDHLYSPLKLGNRVIGYFKDNTFNRTSQNHLNTHIKDESDLTKLSTPFGERPNGSRSEVSNILDFTLKGYDKEIEAVRMGRRFYDPKAKRFLAADSYFIENVESMLGSPVEGNKYSYSLNNPIVYIDLSGKKTYTFSRPLDGDGLSSLGRHQFTVLVPDNPENFPRLIDVGGGKKGVVISGFPEKAEGSRLKGYSNDPGDLNSAREYFSSPDSYKGKVMLVDHIGQTDTNFINNILDKADNFNKNTDSNPVLYPSTSDNIKGTGKNSNTYNQSLLKEAGATSNTEFGSSLNGGINSGENLRFDSNLYKSPDSGSGGWE